MMDTRQQQVVDFIITSEPRSSKEIFDAIGESYSYATLKRILTDLYSDNYLRTTGQGKGTK